jgi:hypothetical protein
MSQRYLGGVITANPTTPTLSAATGVWTMEQQFQNIANWPKSTGLVSRSVRLRSSASAYLNRTPTVAGNRQKWTWSGWVKRGSLSATQVLFGALQNSTTGLGFGFQSTNTFYYSISGVGNYETSAIYRDPSAWYHVVFAFDSTQATQANRAIVYINGVNVAFATNGIVLNTNYDINNTIAQYLGQSGVSTQYLDGYLTEINFIDGQALTPSYFGFTDGNGVWQPATYSGTYGTNGFYLNFSDNSAATATTIGKDYSGNGNNWTPNNISVTAGVTYDSMTDVPTLTSATAANFAVMNPLALPPSGYSAGTFASGNLQFTTGGVKIAKSTIAFPATGKWYVECRSSGTSSTIDWIFGLTGMSAATPVNHSNPGVNLYISDTAYWLLNASTQFSQAGAISSSDVFQIAYDSSTGKVWLGKNNTYYTSAGAGTGNPSAGTNEFGTISTATEYCAYTGGNSGTTTSSINFGQQPFAYTPPSGFVALNTQNLSAPTISNGASYMAATTYTGTGSSLTIANTVGSASFQPDFVWVKGRSGATDHAWYDAVRGVQKQLESNTTTAETTETTGLTAFGSTGFTIGALAQMNTNAATYVGWQWNAGGSTVTNTNGSISAQVRANTTAGFSIVTYTGNGTSGATTGHGLGVTPSMVILRRRDVGSNWQVKHTSLNANQNLVLNDTAAVDTAPGSGYISAISSTTLTLLNGGSAITNVNASGSTYVAYCFAAVAGYSKFGSYTGNGSADGPFVYLGFRPRFVMVKNITNSAGATNWVMQDSSRNGFNPNKTIYANAASAEDSSAYFDILSNGFKVRDTFRDANTSGDTYIYACFAENPFNISRAR